MARYRVHIGVRFGVEAGNKKEAIVKVKKMLRGLDKVVKNPSVLAYSDDIKVQKLAF